MRHVNYIDATGVRAVEQLFLQCTHQKRRFVISGIRPQPQKILEKTGLASKIGRDKIFTNIDDTMEYIVRTLPPEVSAV
jgi:anti-anti-sigma regulatory factor